MTKRFTYNFVPNKESRVKYIYMYTHTHTHTHTHTMCGSSPDLGVCKYTWPVFTELEISELP